MTPRPVRILSQLHAHRRTDIGPLSLTVALSWTLLHLSKDRAMQTKLRQEIRAAKEVAAKEGRTDLSADEILDLPYLDIIVVRPVTTPVD